MKVYSPHRFCLHVWVSISPEASHMYCTVSAYGTSSIRVPACPRVVIGRLVWVGTRWLVVAASLWQREGAGCLSAEFSSERCGWEGLRERGDTQSNNPPSLFYFLPLSLPTYPPTHVSTWLGCPRAAQHSQARQIRTGEHSLLTKQQHSSSGRMWCWLRRAKDLNPSNFFFWKLWSESLRSC